MSDNKEFNEEIKVEWRCRLHEKYSEWKNCITNFIDKEKAKEYIASEKAEDTGECDYRIVKIQTMREILD